jgi:hypothetical protein
MSKLARPLLAICALWLVACVHERPPERIGDLLSHTLLAAQNHHDYALDSEAAALLEAITQVDASYPGLAELRAQLDPATTAGMRRSWMGMNLRMRPEVVRPVWARVLLYLPDRLLDLMDVVSFDVHFGWGVFADVHATRAVQLAAGARTTGGIGLHAQRSLGIKSQGEAGVSVLAGGAQSYAGGLVGTSGAHGAADSFAGLHKPSDALYQGFRDYWGIGASATAGVIGAELELHPLQLADFFAGWIGFDFLRDDFAHTRGLKLDWVDQQRIAELWRIRNSPAVLEAYAAARIQHERTAQPGTEPPTDQPAEPAGRYRPSEQQRLQVPAAIAIEP